MSKGPAPQGGLGPGSGDGAPSAAASTTTAEATSRGRYHVIRTSAGEFVGKVDRKTGVFHWKRRGEAGEVHLPSLLDLD